MEKKLITWTSKFATGHSIIDSQHQILVNLINKLHFAFTGGEAEKHVGPLINELTEYAIFHFKTEEDLFEKVNYIDKSMHIEEHEAFVTIINDFKERVNKRDVDLPYDVMAYMRDWLQEHILLTDKKYVPYIQT